MPTLGLEDSDDKTERDAREKYHCYHCHLNIKPPTSQVFV